MFTSWGTETVEKYDRSEIEQFLDSLADEETYGTILRAKGIVEGTDGSWMEFDYVPGEYEIRDTKADYTGKICVIGTDIHTDNIQQTLHV